MTKWRADITPDIIVEVYYNLHKKCFSIRDKKTKRVIAYTDDVKLHNAVFKVSEAGRQRVLKEKKKNVHAYVVGTFVSYGITDCNPFNEAMYNPYHHDFFIDHCSKKLLDDMYDVVWLTDKKVFYSS